MTDDVVLKRKQNAATKLYEALQGLIKCCEQYGILCTPEVEAARAALDEADGHSTISDFQAD